MAEWASEYEMRVYQNAVSVTPREPNEPLFTYLDRLVETAKAALMAGGRRETGEDKPKPAAPWAAPWDNR